MNINWEFVINKFADLGRFLSDKQLWFKFLIPNLFVLGVLPYVKGPEDFEVLSEQAVALVQLITPVITSLLVGYSKNVTLQSEVNEFIDMLKDNIPQ